MSYEGAPEEGEVAPPFRISHMPPIEEIELTRERARVATPRGAGKAAAKYSVDSGKGKGKGKGKKGQSMGFPPWDWSGNW